MENKNLFGPMDKIPKSKRKIHLKSVHFQNDGIKYGGYTSHKQLKSCLMKLYIIHFQKQILLINQISLHGLKA